ncbi:hypothetical protein FM106_21685 [Brachybacterium faecium]|nr:hypothetical protein FM106_21685 [Brachybacterium faecium]
MKTSFKSIFDCLTFFNSFSISSNIFFSDSVGYYVLKIKNKSSNTNIVSYIKTH